MLGFAYQLLRQVLLGEQAIEEVANAREERVESREGVWEARRQTEVGRRIAKGARGTETAAIPTAAITRHQGPGFEWGVR